jgi:glutathione S-transferase
MITLHYLEDSRAHRILWMLEEVGAPYEVEVYRRDPKTSLAPRELRALHPLGKSPVITDADGVVYAESGAIIEYLAEEYAPELYPSGGEARRESRYWLHYAEGSLMPFLVMQLVFGKARARIPRIARPLLMAVPSLITKAYLGPNVERHLAFVEGHLEGRSFFVGDALTVADIQMSFAAEAIAERAPGEYPNIEAYVRGIQAREAYARALDAVPLEYGYVAR